MLLVNCFVCTCQHLCANNQRDMRRREKPSVHTESRMLPSVGSTRVIVSLPAHVAAVQIPTSHEGSWSRSCARAHGMCPMVVCSAGTLPVQPADLGARTAKFPARAAGGVLVGTTPASSVIIRQTLLRGRGHLAPSGSAQLCRDSGRFRPEWPLHCPNWESRRTCCCRCRTSACCGRQLSL